MGRDIARSVKTADLRSVTMVRGDAIDAYKATIQRLFSIPVKLQLIAEYSIATSLFWMSSSSGPDPQGIGRVRDAEGDDREKRGSN